MLGLDRRDPIAFDADVEFLIGLGRRIEHRAAGEKKIESVAH